jgi:tRNA A37 threonylcarbamoyladenosine biosynthesis protein TsaE
MGLLGDEAGKAPLYQQLKQLPSKVNLTEPLLLLVDNLRKGGNIAAHFDLEREPDQHVAEAMIDLLDYFFEYIFVLRERASSLEVRIEALGKNGIKG